MNEVAGKRRATDTVENSAGLLRGDLQLRAIIAIEEVLAVGFDFRNGVVTSSRSQGG
jgi:hypothetical protein